MHKIPLDTLRARGFGVLLYEPIPEPRPRYGALTDSHFDSMAKANAAMWRDVERWRGYSDLWRERAERAEARMRQWRRAALVAFGVVLLAVGVLLWA